MSLIERAESRLARLRQEQRAPVAGCDISDQSDETSALLTNWLATEQPHHVESPGENVTLDTLNALAGRVWDDFLDGRRILAASAPDHPRRAEAQQRLDQDRERIEAVTELAQALAGHSWDRRRLAAWLAIEGGWKANDMESLLAMVDEIGTDVGKENR